MDGRPTDSLAAVVLIRVNCAYRACKHKSPLEARSLDAEQSMRMTFIPHHQPVFVCTF